MQRAREALKSAKESISEYVSKHEGGQRLQVFGERLAGVDFSMWQHLGGDVVPEDQLKKYAPMVATLTETVKEVSAAIGPPEGTLTSEVVEDFDILGNAVRDVQRDCTALFS